MHSQHQELVWLSHSAESGGWLYQRERNERVWFPEDSDKLVGSTASSFIIFHVHVHVPVVLNRLVDLPTRTSNQLVLLVSERACCGQAR